MRVRVYAIAVTIVLLTVALISSLMSSTSPSSSGGDIRMEKIAVPLISNQDPKAPTELHNLPGGYSPVESEDPNIKDQLVQVAEFAVSSLIDADETTPTTPPPYTFLPRLKQNAGGNHYRVKIAEASQQVVAGMNFNLLIALYGNEDDDGCIGSFWATVYDHFGAMSVTDWGEEVSCQQLHAVMENGT